MKLTFTFFTLYFFLTAPVFAHQDISAYETQRTIVNKLLQDRSDKFGQYDNSLTMRTGIFGLKTKKDMQRSNNILTEIVRTDNAIFKELKILLDYKDLEKTKVESKANESEGRIDNYRRTITKLQVQNEKLGIAFKEAENDYDFLTNLMILSLILIAVLVVWLYKLKK